ncbi:hypothetical protein [Actinomarinicola tropica]|uniref:SCP2 domain-containing protein n=1 Tax=Actinomarinicola tropica TaxID=2789776 RepID=A0A5Q2RIR0_9ACTN|nr:hypothetical protein [Actinomarinicola tropica]QGG94772.1 hypothetical protein GH723_06420 [Actinomarinicola tropica]
MSELLSDEWFAAVDAALASAADDGPAAEPVAAEVELVVSGAAAGTVATRWVVEDGRLASVRPAGDGDEATTTVPITAEDLRAVLVGEDDAAIRYMRGDLKPEGRTADVLALVSALARPACRAALAGTVD